MKIYLAYNIIDAPYGGANQFFSSLKKELEKRGVFTADPSEAGAIVFNSHTLGGNKGNGPATITRLKYQFPKAIFIHRVDGPVSVYRGSGKHRFVDYLIYSLNYDLADGTIYQSSWSRQANLNLGKKPTVFSDTIVNAPDSTIFYPPTRDANFVDRKIKVIASSFSNHPNKGFAVYQWLDENLDFSRYEMTFVGNTPVEFRNIQHVPAVAPRELADLLREHDVFITASQKDPCSNALIEALHCGLPAIALRDGGHPEIVGQAGELFDTKEEIPSLLERIVGNYEFYQHNNQLPTISEVAAQYQSLVHQILQAVHAGTYHTKKLSWVVFWYRYMYYRVSQVLRAAKGKIIGK
jgi:glycosyltransferase involved in cell wall biosynthesis